MTKSKNYIVSIELPTCNKDKFETNTLSMLPILAPLSDYCKWNINFQKQFSNEDLERYKKIFQTYGFDVSSKITQYSNRKKYLSICTFREDTHQIDPSCPYTLSIDDDVVVTDEEYTKIILASIYYSLANNNVGAVCIESHSFGRNKNKEYQLLTKHLITKLGFWTDGGILVKNLSSFQGLFKPECYSLLGTHQDDLLVKLRLQEGLTAYQVVTDSFQHYEVQKDGGIPGGHVYGWDAANNEQHSIRNYSKNIRINVKQYNESYSKEFDFSKYSISELKSKIDNLLEIIQ